MVDLQLQTQNIIKLADVVNNQLADIKTVLLQTGETYKIKISRDIYSILRNIIYGDMEWQAYHI